MVDRLLLIVNAASGTGAPPTLPGRLAERLAAGCPRIADVELALVSDHASAREAARAFAAGSELPAAVVVGGGGGTLRAAVEGVYDAGAEARTVMGALRMGSGNVTARRLGVALDPLAGCDQLVRALRHLRVSAVPVLRCDFGSGVRRAVVMCGLGQWGRTSGDLARWHARSPRLRTTVASIAGIERLNHAEYVAAAGLRLVEAAVFPQSCELVEARCGGAVGRFRLLAGAVVTMPVPGLPLRPGVTLVPLAGRPRRFALQPGDALDIRLLDRDSVEFFLDEDPEVARGAIHLEVAGSLPFLTAEVLS